MSNDRMKAVQGLLDKMDEESMFRLNRGIVLHEMFEEEPEAFKAIVSFFNECEFNRKGYVS